MKPSTIQNQRLNIMRVMLIIMMLVGPFFGLQAQQQPTADQLIYLVKPVAFNSPSRDYAPIILDNEVLFVSDRQTGYALRNEINLNDQTPQTNIFRYDGIQAEPEEILNNLMNQGPMSYIPDLEMMIVTNSHAASGRDSVSGFSEELKLSFYQTMLPGWEKTGEFPYNNENYSLAHPSYDPQTRTLYFVSNMPGGKGGTDIYYSELIKGQWSKPLNLEAVNTPDNEMFPSIDPTTGDLYFSSDQLGEVAGFDVYRVSTRSHTAPIRLRAPINSAYDDFGFIIDQKGSSGFFSSNRPGGEGMDDIYAFDLHKTAMIARLVDNMTNQPINGELIVREASNGKILPVLSVNGQIIFAGVYGRSYELVATSEGYKEMRTTIVISRNRQIAISMVQEKKKESEDLQVSL